MTATPALASVRANLGRTLQPIHWLENPRIPEACAAVLDALKFTNVAPRLAASELFARHAMARQALASYSESDWKQALRFCDESRLTLLVGSRCEGELPSWVAQRIHRNLEGNAARLKGLKREYARIAESLAAASVEHVVLKGFSHGPSFGPDSRLRPQYDLDLWCRESQLAEARDAVTRLGFESVAAQGRFPTDHLPPMVRKTGWDWKGDYFDAEMPPVVEIHFALWDERMERLAAPGLDAFWGRSRREPRGDITIPVMHEADQFAFAALHALRHLLRGDLRALHVYEIAHFLHARQADAQFWNEWRELHAPDLRRLQSLACALARKWFACDLPPAVVAEIDALPSDAHAWFENYAACAVESRFAASKDELWLHLALLSSVRDKAAVLRRRIIPLNLPGRVESEFVPEKQRTVRGRFRGAVQYVAFCAARARYHVLSWGALCSSGLRWWRIRRHSRGLSGAPGASSDGIEPRTRASRDGSSGSRAH